MENHNNNPIGVSETKINWDGLSIEHNLLYGEHDSNQNNNNECTVLNAMTYALYMVQLNGAPHTHHLDNNFQSDRFFNDIGFNYLENYDREYF